MALPRIPVALCLALALAACGDGPAGTGTGTIEVTTITTGEDVDPDGYAVRVEGVSTPQAVGSNATASLAEVPAGDLEVRLTALQGNCRVQGTMPRIIRVVAGETFQLRFEVLCTRAPLLGRLVFVSSRGGNFEIYSARPDGSDRVRLTDTPDDQELQASSSPDGSKILYQRREGGLFNDSFQWDVFVMNADGTGQVNVSQYEGHDQDPVWSPDGSRIAFVRDFDIWAMNLDGTDQVNLTDTPTSFEYAPLWSPDGSRIFYGAGDGRRHVMNADGSGQAPLPDDAAEASAGTVSPDGTRIVFTASESGTSKVYVMNADGTHRVRVTDAPGYEFAPSWSPDGRRLAFTSDAIGRDDIYVVGADGTGLTNITTDVAAVEQTGPRAWGP